VLRFSSQIGRFVSRLDAHVNDASRRAREFRLPFPVGRVPRGRGWFGSSMASTRPAPKSGIGGAARNDIHLFRYVDLTKVGSGWEKR